MFHGMSAWLLYMEMVKELDGAVFLLTFEEMQVCCPVLLSAQMRGKAFYLSLLTASLSVVLFLFPRRIHGLRKGRIALNCH